MTVSKKTQVLIAIIIIMAASAYPIYWLIQNQTNITQSASPSFHGNGEIGKDYIRLWTAIQPNSWSGMTTAQKWSFLPSLTLEAQIKITSLGSPTFYAETILVNEGESEVEEGFGFQITNATQDQVRIKGWSWDEEGESFSTYTDKPTNVFINLQARKIGIDQIDFYVDNILIGSIFTHIPIQEGILDIDITNGNQGGFSEIFFNYQVQQET